MIREFLMPYYQQLIANLRSRQIDKKRHLWIQVDTTRLPPVIDVYRDGIGMDSMSPSKSPAAATWWRSARNTPT